MKIRVGDKTYEAKGVSEIEMDHLIRMQEETGIGDATFDRMMTAEMARMQQYEAEVEIAEKEGTEPPNRPDSDMKLLVLTIWLARLCAGEDITWIDARKVRLQDVEIVTDDPATEEKSDPTPAAEKPSASSGKKPRTLAAAS